MKRNLLIVASLALLMCSGCGTLPQPPVTTVWQKLGIPQGLIGLRDGLTNRKGNFPGLERKPPLLPLAAPENLESPYDMIKVGAEVKMAEDLAPQKIKALKYLGSIGCGCYDKEGAIEAALLEGLSDCTADVRIAAAEAIQEATGECACVDGCAQTCCTEKIQEKLAELAYGEEDGCWIEPNAEVREAALAALSACPPLMGPEVIVEPENPGVIPEGAEDGAPVVPPMVPGSDTINTQGTPTSVLIQSSSNEEVPVISGSGEYYPQASRAVQNVEQDQELQKAIDALVPTVHVEPEFAVVQDDDQSEAGLIPAMIESLDEANGIVQIAFFDSYEIPVGTSMVLVDNGQEIDVVVTESELGRATTDITKSEDGTGSSLAAGEVVNVGILAD